MRMCNIKLTSCRSCFFPKLKEIVLGDKMLNHEVNHYQMYQYMHAGDEISDSLYNYQHLTPMKGFFIGLFHIESDRT